MQQPSIDHKAIRLAWATPDDTKFVAWGICCALHREPEGEFLDFVADICRREDVLYSYRHALIAWADGEPVGLCLCYDGHDYHAMRLRTFALFPQGDDDMDLEHMQDESGPGEYYIDSLAVKPAYRHRGIAHQLMQQQISVGQSRGLECTLLVDPLNPSALGLYQSLGFEYKEECYAFGQIFHKMKFTKR